jgi:hypothetical protein
MSRITTKYLVADEEGPLRAFYDRSEAERFAQPGWTIKEVREVRYQPKPPSYEDLLYRCGEADF